ncbi:MAG: hydroxyacid dehydrogenase [Desulfobacterales bacterium]|jgi:(S)-sulfolactate dehydrogenase
MAQIIISEFMDREAVESATAEYVVHYDPELVDKPDELKAMLQNAEALVVRNRTRVNQDLLDNAPQLKVIGRLGVGLDNIDLEACKQRGVQVCPATGANDAAVAEWVITSAMMLLRGAFFKTSQMLAGKWPRQESMGSETAGKMLGLVGFGGIARETAKRARFLGMKILAYDPYIPADTSCWQETLNVEHLNELLEAADVVSLHVPLTKETHHMIDSDAFSRMKKEAFLINAARGGVVDEKELVAAIKTGRLAGAALDVFENEPLTESSAALFDNVPNLVLTPHIAGVTIESNQRVSRVTMQNVIDVLGKSH